MINKKNLRIALVFGSCVGLVVLFTNGSKPSSQIRFKEEILLEGLSDVCGCEIEIEKSILAGEEIAPKSLKGIYKGLNIACRIDAHKVCSQIHAVSLFKSSSEDESKIGTAKQTSNPSILNGVISFDIEKKIGKKRVLKALGISTEKIQTADSL